MLNLIKSEISLNDRIFCIFCLCIIFLAFGSSGSSFENSIQGIIFLLFSIPVLTNILIIRYYKKEIYYLLAFITPLLFSTINSIFPINIESWLRVISLFSLLLCFLAIYIFFHKNTNYIKHVIHLLITLGIFHITTITNKILSLQKYQQFNWTTDIYFFGNIRHITSFITMVFICTLYLTLEKTRYKIIYFILSTIFLTFIMWSGTRSAYLSLLLVSIYFILTTTNKIKTILTIASLISLSLFLSLLLPQGNSLGINRALSNSGSGRWEIWLDTVHYIIQKPFVGYGADSFSQVHLLYGGHGAPFQQAHNFILQIFIEFGLIGFISITFIFYHYGKKIKIHANPDQRLFFSILINYSIIGLFDGVAYYTFSLFFIGLAVAILNTNNKKRFI